MAENQSPKQILFIRLYALIMTAGAVTLGMELSAARLLEPIFGNNQIVWAVLIGLVLLYLAIGAWLGGILSDRFPTKAALDMVLTVAGIAIALIPLLSQPVLQAAASGFSDFDTALLAGSFVAILALFTIPGILLGTASPWAVRLAIHDLAQAGHVAGRLYALATVGSIIGTFLPVLWLIPAYGTRWTFYLLALLLLAVIILTSLPRRHVWLPILAFVAVLTIALWTQPSTSIRSAWDDGRAGQIIYEDESRYNYIAVRQWGEERHLKLNDGIGIHSVYHPNTLLSIGIWDYFLLAPLFNPLDDRSPIDNALIIGSAAGTISELLTNIYGPISITGVELDPQIIEVGERYFEMNQPNLTSIAADGRYWLAQQPVDTQWDFIAVDAYRPPYIPFHLTTIEFFALVRSRLSDNGVLAINIGRTAENYELVDALAATVAQEFSSLYLIDEPGPENDLGNSLLIATAQPTALENLAQNIEALSAQLPVEFRDFAERNVENARTVPIAVDAPVLTDDRAPIEQIVHGIILDFFFGSD